jgi:hypothetical protein
MNEAAIAAVSAIVAAVAGSGVTTVFFQWWVKHALDEAQKKKDDAEAARKKKEADAEAAQQRRYELADARDHATSRVLFWIDHGLKKFEEETGKRYWNGDLAAAFESLNKANEAIKAFDREQLAKLNTK